MVLENSLSNTKHCKSEVNPSISVKRTHGLGNIVCLLPVLDKFYTDGYRVKVVTRQEWIHTFSTLRPEFVWTTESGTDTIDLDSATEHVKPKEHRSDEFGRMLGIGRPFQSTSLTVPEKWSQQFEEYRDTIVFAPEGGHPSRCWPYEYARQLKGFLNGKHLTLIGLENNLDIPCDADLRGKLTLHELFGLLATVKMVVTMDSGVLHIAAALNKPTVALFGGVNPMYRIRSNQPVVAIQSGMDCCPCNKNEVCESTYSCIRHTLPEDVIQAIALAENTTSRTIYKVIHSEKKARIAG